MTVVLVFSQYYLPGYRAGGPIRSVSGVVENLTGDEFKFLVVAGDRDYGDQAPYPLATAGKGWVTVGDTHVRYVSPGENAVLAAWLVLRRTQYDVVYLNSLFSIRYTLAPWLLMHLRLVPRKPIVLAPRGELGAGAMAFKGWKKRLYLAVAQISGMFSGILWQASSVAEAEDIKRMVGPSARVHIAPNLPTAALSKQNRPLKPKVAGAANIIFFSRISPIKNLEYALKVIGQVHGRVSFDIYGAITDQDYWKRCEALIAQIRGDVRIRYRGEMAHDKVQSMFRNYDLLLLPTQGENFGHVIFESFAAGCPVLISDRTPWRDLESHRAGWDIDLASPDSFIYALQRVIDMDNEQLDVLRQGALMKASAFRQNQDAVDRNRELFRSATCPA